MQLNDLRRAYYDSEGIDLANVMEMERQWLIAELGGGSPYTTMSRTELWHEYWDSVSAYTPAAGTFNDRAFDWLGNAGYTGALSERWYAYFLDLYPT